MEILDARNEKELFIKLYNRYVIYAPYSIKLDESIFAGHLSEFAYDRESCILICSLDHEHGLIHFGRHNEKDGMIYLLFADSNQMAAEMLDIAEKWFAERGVGRVMAYLGHPSPYQYILHGSEPYCWAGNYHANNAFRRLGYDLELDILVMTKKLSSGSTEPVRAVNFDIKEEAVRDDDLALSGLFTAFKDGIWAGRCGYHYLKALSDQLGKKTGQIEIWLNEAYHGTELSGAILAMSHAALKDLGADRVMLATNQALFRAVKFYEKTGYETEPIRAYSYVKILDV